MNNTPWLLALMIGSMDMGVTAQASPLVLPLMAVAAEASPPWGPAQGVRARGYSRYRFYPSLEVYFDLDRHMWFAFDAASGEWVMTTRRPWTVMFRFPSFIEVDIRGDRPYLYHTQIYGRYAPPGRRTVVVERRRDGRGDRDRDRGGWNRDRGRHSDADRGRGDGKDSDNGDGKGKGKDKDKEKDQGTGKDRRR